MVFSALVLRGLGIQKVMFKRLLFGSESGLEHDIMLFYFTLIFHHTSLLFVLQKSGHLVKISFAYQHAWIQKRVGHY